MMPSVPSAPMKRCLRSYPVLSFRSPRQAVPHAPVRQHRFEAQAQVAGGAVAQHAGAARIGGQVAADPRRSFSAEAQREVTISLLGRLLDVGEDYARLDGDRVVERVDLAHAVEARQGDQDFAAVLVGRRGAAQPGVAALRHDGRRGLVADADGLGHLGDRGRANHHRRRARVAPALVREIGGHVRGVRDDPGVADDGADAFENARIDVDGGSHRAGRLNPCGGGGQRPAADGPRASACR